MTHFLTNNLIKYSNTAIDLLKIKLQIKRISPDTILENHEIIKPITRQMILSRNYSACGVSSQAIFNILLMKHNIPLSSIRYYVNEKANIKQLLNRDCILLVRLLGTPDHAFIVYNIFNKSILIQSYVGQYDHRKHVDILPRKKMLYYLKVLKEMYRDNIIVSNEMVEVLTKLTHLNHMFIYEGEKSNGEEFSVFYAPIISSKL